MTESTLSAEMEARKQAARNAGGMTITELRRAGLDGNLAEQRLGRNGDIDYPRYYDADTDLWITKGVALFRRRLPDEPWPPPVHDTLEIV